MAGQGTGHDRVDPRGMLLAIVGPIINNSGAALGAMAMPTMGSVGVVAIRQAVAAIAFSIVAWPNWRSFSLRNWTSVIAFGVVLGLLSVCVYTAIDRIGLGLAITIEFLGPLAVAVAMARRLADLIAVIVAAIGIVVLVRPGPTTDVPGVGLAVLAAAGWAAYILLNRHIGRSLPGLQGTAAASLISLVIWTPIAVLWFMRHPPELIPVLLALSCGILSSVVPNALDLAALRRISPSLYSMLASLNPVWAALCGLVILGQELALHEWIGVAIVAASNAYIAVRALC